MSLIYNLMQDLQNIIIQAYSIVKQWPIINIKLKFQKCGQKVSVIF